MDTKVHFHTGKITYVSPYSEKFGGYKPEDEIGSHISKFISSKTDLLKGLKLLTDIFISKKSGTFEFMYKAKNNTRFPVELTYVPLIKSDKVYAIQMVLRNITGRKKTEKTIKENEEKLREINAEKDKFFSIIAHDLKGPFNSMLGFSDLLISNFDKYDDKKKKKFIRIIQQSAQNTYKLLENLLLWSRAQRGVIEFFPENSNLYLLSVEAKITLNQSLKDKSIILFNHIPEDINVEADRNMILTVFRNLISNAIKFTPNKGKITLDAKIITDKKKQNYIEISVKDTGIGIAKENLNRLFKISENISTKGSKGETGTGLGLILCKEFVQKHGGEISVESKADKGSTFSFTLPLSKIHDI